MTMDFMNLAAAWDSFAEHIAMGAELSDEDLDYARNLFYSGAQAIELCLRNIKRLHQDNLEAATVLILAIDTEIREWRQSKDGP